MFFAFYFLYTPAWQVIIETMYIFPYASHMYVKTVQTFVEKNKDWVLAYPVMHEYGSLAFESNSEVGEATLGRGSIFCVCTGTF